MERIFSLFISEILILLFMVRIGYWQIICGPFYFCYFLPRNNISLPFISVTRCFKVGRKKHWLKVNTFVFPLDQRRSQKQIVPETWNHSSPSSWLLIFPLIDTRSVLSFHCFDKYFQIYFGQFWEFIQMMVTSRCTYIQTFKILLIISGVNRLPEVYMQILNMNSVFLTPQKSTAR